MAGSALGSVREDSGSTDSGAGADSISGSASTGAGLTLSSALVDGTGVSVLDSRVAIWD